MRTRILKIALFILIVSNSQAVFSQLYPLDQKTADSLEEFLPSVQGVEKVNILNRMSYALLRHYSNRSDSLATLALSLARELDYSQGIAKALYCKGTNVYMNGDFITSLNMLYEAADIFQELKDTSMLIDTYIQVGSISFFSLTDISETIRLSNLCVELAIQSGNKLREAQMYSAMQYVVSYAGGEKKRREYLQKYQEIATELPISKVEKLWVTGTFGTYDDYEGKYRDALENYFKSWRMADLDDVEERAYVAMNALWAGNAYSSLNMPDSALYCFQYGMRLARKFRHYLGSMVSASRIAGFYLNNGEYSRALAYCDSVVHYGMLIESTGSFFGFREYDKLIGMGGELYFPLTGGYKKYLAWSYMARAYQWMKSAYQARGENGMALEIYDHIVALNDSLNSYEKRKELLELQYKYQGEKKDDQILMLSQQNQLQEFKISQNRLVMFSVIAISILALVVLALFLYQNRIRSERKLAEFKQRLFRSQMNPHFIFNSLTSVQNFILSHEEIKASVYLSRFSDLVRSILNNSQQEWITLEEEVVTLENYLELQKVRFPDKFEYTIDIDEQLNSESIEIPPMLIQPFIENSIEHGFKLKDIGGHIDLRLKKIDNALVVEIEDNGIGRKKSEELKRPAQNDHKSMATMITRERIKAINKKIKGKIKFEIIDLYNEDGRAMGTRVVLIIPL